ncbi:hypothetical protein GS966_28145 [Rhodococcus hoagii]|nr:hypothetical protein [Prescottella equi]
MVLALQAKGLPGGKYRHPPRHRARLAAFGAILMNIGTLSSSAGVAMKIAAVAAAVILWQRCCGPLCGCAASTERTE